MTGRGRLRTPGARAEAVVLLLVVTVVATSLSSCGLGARTKRMFGGKLPMQVVVDQDVNDNSPVAVELVVVYDKELLESLTEVSAREWFDQRDQYRRDYPKDFDSWIWEWVPGQDVDDRKVDIKTGAKGGLIFADYYVAGNHRQRIDPKEPFRLVLGEKGFTVQPAQKKKRKKRDDGD